MQWNAESSNSIKQYLRINNVEIVGLPEPSDDESHEQVLPEALNSMQDLTCQMTNECGH